MRKGVKKEGREAGMDESLAEKRTTERKPHREETVRAESPVNPA